MALPTTHFGVHFLSSLDLLRSDLRFRRDLDRSSCLLGLPPRREVLYISDQIGPLLSAQCSPRRHRRTVQSSRDRIKEVFVGGQGSGRRGAAFEYCQLKIARLWVQGGLKPSCARSFAIPQLAMAGNAIAVIVHNRVFRVTGKVTDMTCHCRRIEPLVLLVLRDLRR